MRQIRVSVVIKLSSTSVCVVHISPLARLYKGRVLVYQSGNYVGSLPRGVQFT